MWNIPTKEQLDKIPRLYETEEIPLTEKIVYLHFFIFGSDWFIAEYDGDDLFWGFAVLNTDYINAEWGYISFRELREININGFEIGCDKYWKPVPVREIDVIKKCINSGCYEKQGMDV